MFSTNAMKIMAGAAAGGVGAGMLGRKHAANDPDMDTEDRFAFTTSSVIAGIAGGALLGKIGIGNLAKGAVAGARGIAGGAVSIGRVAKGVGSVARTMGAGKAPWLKGPMKLLAVTAASVGAVAYGARSKPQTAAYASRNEEGETEYSQHSVKERVGMMGAAGDMVFGMHNTRHG